MFLTNVKESILQDMRLYLDACLSEVSLKKDSFVSFTFWRNVRIIVP